MAENAVRIPRFQPLVLADAHAQYFRHLALGKTLLLPGLLQISSHGFLHSNLGRLAGRAGFEPAREKGCKAAVSSPRSDLESAAIDRSATAPSFSARAAPIAARATCRSYPGGPPLPLRVSSGSLGVFHRLPACPADSGPVLGKDREPLTQGPLQRLSLRWFPAMAPMPKGKSMGAMRLGL